jgi:tryptophanyl-tRNA synthetase
LGPTFLEPEAKLTTFPMVVGLDGKDKMSKSLDNYLEICLT